MVNGKMPHEETRRLIKLGDSLVITIPKAWTRYYNLKQKDAVTVISNGSVTIKPSKLEGKEEEPKKAIRDSSSSIHKPMS